MGLKHIKAKGSQWGTGKGKTYYSISCGQAGNLWCINRNGQLYVNSNGGELSREVSYRLTTPGYIPLSKTIG